MQNISHENDLIFKRMNVQVTAFSYEWFGTKTRFARGKSQLFIHELLREPLISNVIHYFPERCITQNLISCYIVIENALFKCVAMQW